MQGSNAKEKSGWTGKSSFVLDDPLRYLHPSIIYPVPFDWIVQRAYWLMNDSVEKVTVDWNEGKESKQSSIEQKCGVGLF